MVNDISLGLKLVNMAIYGYIRGGEGGGADDDIEGGDQEIGR
jgi:hypothetical protein